MKLPKCGVRAAALVYGGSGVMLVCNDWWFKGAGILPAWLTGKLSDFAGLTLAIITASLLLGQRNLGGAKLACGAITVVFALAKLDRTCTELLVTALASIGLNWSVRTDPADLVALAVVPSAWSAAQTLTLRLQQAGVRRLLLRASAIPAALACLASGEPNTFSASGYVYNDSGKVVFVEVSVPRLSCGDEELVRADWIEQGDFESTGLYQIGPHEVLPLLECYCVYRISFEGKSVVVRVRENPVSLPKKPEREQVNKAREHLIFARRGGDLLPGSSFEVLEVPVTAPASSCPDEPAPMTFGARVTDLVNAHLVAIEPVAGQCWELQLATGELPGATSVGGAAGAPGAPALGGAAGLGGAGPDSEVPSSSFGDRIQLCMPRDLIPFRVGDVVTLAVRASTSYGITHQLKLIEQSGARGLRLELGAMGLGRAEEYTVCGPSRDSEGQLYLPVQVTAYPNRGVEYFSGAIAVSDLSPGERREAVLVDGTRTQVYVGRARRFPHTGGFFGHSTYDRSCPGDSPPLDWIEVVESWSE